MKLISVWENKFHVYAIFKFLKVLKMVDNFNVYWNIMEPLWNDNGMFLKQLNLGILEKLPPFGCNGGALRAKQKGPSGPPKNVENQFGNFCGNLFRFFCRNPFGKFAEIYLENFVEICLENSWKSV